MLFSLYSCRVWTLWDFTSSSISQKICPCEESGQSSYRSIATWPLMMLYGGLPDPFIEVLDIWDAVLKSCLLEFLAEPFTEPFAEPLAEPFKEVLREPLTEFFAEPLLDPVSVTKVGKGISIFFSIYSIVSLSVMQRSGSIPLLLNWAWSSSYSSIWLSYKTLDL